MDTNRLKRFAQESRSKLLKIADASLDHLNGNSNTDQLVEIAERQDLLKEIQKKLESKGKEAFKEEIAYTWFNRFIALRFMDLNEFTDIKTVSSSSGYFQPELLQAFKEGHCPDYLPVDKSRLYSILNGTIPSRDPQNEVYRNLLLGVCNYWHEKMPFMFEKLHDYTELLMPGDLLSENSIIADITRNITEEDCRDVEVIGWLYQFYISEKKETVIGSKQKIKTADIPAATQLFTPHWIVRYLVENSLGRLWMLNNPDSDLLSKMDYYIKPEEQETDFLKISSPEEIRICDPACGSGHMLTYAFDLLTRIYEEEGYDKPEIPRLILRNNLYGMEIDQRAASLAAFALTMKAREYDHRFFRRGDLKPNILRLEKLTFEESELEAYKDYIGEEIYTPDFEETLLMFELADNAGSLLQPKIVTPDYYLQKLASLDLNGSLALANTHKRVLSVLRQTMYLAGKYHCVVANPPYMGNKSLNDALKAFAKKNYPDSKSDLFAMFIERNLVYSLSQGYVGMITMQSWMFLSTFENTRDKLLDKGTLISITHLGARAFDTISGEVVSTTSFIFENYNRPDFKGSYLRLVEGKNEAAKIEIFKENLPSDANSEPELYYRASASDFKKIPGSPIAYWIAKRLSQIYENSNTLDQLADSIQGMITGNNNKFLRLWYEVDRKKLSLDKYSINEVKVDEAFWIPYNKGGDLRKWYGNNEFVLNWKNHGRDLTRSRTQNAHFYFKPCITWTFISSSFFAARQCGKGFVWDVAGSSAFPRQPKDTGPLLCLMCSKVGKVVLDAINPTLNYQVENILSLPIHGNLEQYCGILNKILGVLVSKEKIDWNSYESSWDFTTLPLFQPDYLRQSLKVTYENLRQHWREMTQEMKHLEEENNRIFIEAYGLEDELTPDVPIEEITLTCNPYYRYGNNKSEKELETLLLADTMKEFISYAVGCMLGRYSLDKPCLILANQGETLEDYIKNVGVSREDLRYMPDEDNVIPITDGEYFEDDIVTRFKQFLKITFGDEHYEENLAFVENAIGKDIRKYFLSDFYRHHVRIYKKRPIYWLFSSPKKTFNALIYIHRYRPDTVSVVLNDYLREFIHKLEAHINNLTKNLEDASLTSSGRGKLQKEIEELKKKVNELKDYEREVVYPLATERIEIDLDDGVKVNYAKFGKALASI